MPKKNAKKSPKPMARKQMKKTKGGAFAGGVRIAVGDVNGDGLSLKKNPGSVQIDPNNPN